MVNVMSCYISMLHKMVKLAGMQSKQVEIEPGTVINYWVPSSKSHNNKPPLVLIHGFALDGILTWQFQVLSSLRKTYSLYIPDLVFFGGSHTTRKDRSTRFQADCLAKGLRKLGVEGKCMVVGFSYGGFVGFQMAEHYPDLVGSMVITGSVAAWSESVSSKGLERVGGFSNWAEVLLPNSADGVKAVHAGSYKLPWMPHFCYKHYLQVMFSNRKERVELLEASVVRDEDVSNHHFQQRIHLLWGNEDRIWNMEVANKLREQLGGKCRLQAVKKAGHLVMVERFFAFNTHLKAMLASLAADREAHI